MYKIIASHLHKYRSPEVRLGRITSSADLKYLGKKVSGKERRVASCRRRATCLSQRARKLAPRAPRTYSGSAQAAASIATKAAYCAKLKPRCFFSAAAAAEISNLTERGVESSSQAFDCDLLDE